MVNIRTQNKIPAMTENQYYRSRFARIMSWSAFQRLQERVVRAQSLPTSPMSVTQYFGESKSTNLLTRIVLFWLKRDGIFAYRNSSQGIARRMENGQVNFVPASKHARGAGDIFAKLRKPYQNPLRFCE